MKRPKAREHTLDAHLNLHSGLDDMSSPNSESSNEPYFCEEEPLADPSLCRLCYRSGEIICTIPWILFQTFAPAHAKGTNLSMVPDHFPREAVKWIVECMETIGGSDAAPSLSPELTPIGDVNARISMYAIARYWRLDDVYVAELARNIRRSIRVSGNQLSFWSLDLIAELQSDPIFFETAKKLALLDSIGHMADPEIFERWIDGQDAFARAMRRFDAV
jgi:hypothetical protein